MIPRGALRASLHIQRIQATSPCKGCNPVALNVKHRRGLHAQIRLHSAVTGSTVLKASTVRPPPATLPTPKKKVELNPSPRKTPSPNVFNEHVSKRSDPPPSTSVGHSERQSQEARNLTSSTTHKMKDTKEVSPIQLAIEDMRKAEQHGILAPPPADAGRIRKLIHQGKELFKFYWHGLRLIYVHRKTVKDIQRRLAEEKAAGREASITRWEWQFIRTYKQDVARLVPFILILLILEEILPLVVLYVPGILPSTCILPSQYERIRQKAESDRVAAMLPIKEWLRSSGIKTQSVLEGGVRGLDGSLVKNLCRAFNLASWGPSFLTRSRLQHHLEYLREDDTLLASEGRGRLLSSAEARRALSERAFILQDLQETELLPTLANWLDIADNEQRRVSFVLDRALSRN